jgi:hypothetical protein
MGAALLRDKEKRVGARWTAETVRGGILGRSTGAKASKAAPPTTSNHRPGATRFDLPEVVRVASPSTIKAPSRRSAAMSDGGDRTDETVEVRKSR